MFNRKSKDLTLLIRMLMAFTDPSSMTRTQSELFIELINCCYKDGKHVLTDLDVLNFYRCQHLDNEARRDQCTCDHLYPTQLDLFIETKAS